MSRDLHANTFRELSEVYADLIRHAGFHCPTTGNFTLCHGKEICIHLFYSRESEYLVVCPRLLHIKTTRMNVKSFVDTYSVIQFENGGCLHHSHLNPQNVNLSPARVFTGARLFMVL